MATAPLARLRTAPWLHDAETQRLFALLDGAEGRTRAVGGVVRDTLLERVRDSGEIDFATELLPEEVMRRAAAAGIAAYPTGIEHGTVTLKLGTLLAEVTTLREDVETFGRHATVRFGTDWRRDAERRDFTMNALYVGPDGVLFDPLGGIADCIEERVRFIGDADQRIAEDRLRVYRFFRFTASHGRERFDEDGLAAVARAAGTLEALSAERVGGEMRRMLDLAKVGRSLGEMRAAGILDLGAVTIEQLQAYERHAAKPSFSARLALILAHSGSEGLKLKWRLANDEISTAERVLAAAHLLIDFRINEAAYRQPAVLADAVEVAAALAGWTEAGKGAVVQRLTGVDVAPLPINGTDLIHAGLRPGPGLGVELGRLEKLWIDSDFQLSREALLQAIRRPPPHP